MLPWVSVTVIIALRTACMQTCNVQKHASAISEGFMRKHLSVSWFSTQRVEKKRLEHFQGGLVNRFARVNMAEGGFQTTILNRLSTPVYTKPVWFKAESRVLALIWRVASHAQ